MKSTASFSTSKTKRPKVFYFGEIESREGVYAFCNEQGKIDKDNTYVIISKGQDDYLRIYIGRCGEIEQLENHSECYFVESDQKITLTFQN